MRILLLGSTGYLGTNIANTLSAEGHEVYCVVRRTSNLQYLEKRKNINLISNDAGQIELTLREGNIDWIINAVCTYRTNESLYGDMLESNVLFPLSVLNAAMKYNVKNFMTMGTGLPEVFNAYSFTKAKMSDFGKFFSENEDINFVELRLEMFYGGLSEPRGRFLRSCADKLLMNEPLELTSGYQKRDIIRVEDIVGIIDTLMSSDYAKGYKILPVGSGEQHSIREIINYMKEKSGSASELKFGAIPSRAGEPDTLADTSWYDEIGYSMKYSYFEGLKQELKDEPVAKVGGVSLT